jgi:hypothetical protein
MDFDPGELHDDDYEDGMEENMPDEEPDAEYDSAGNIVFAAAAAGFGYHMAQDELEERQIAENILKRREGKQYKPTKIPLAERHTTKGHMTPFGRWATKANIDHKRTEDEIEYTKEERLQIMDSEGDWDG